jgi:predicted KAP-like P-loop ATPase
VESTQRAFCELIQVSLNGLEKEEGYKLKRIVFCIDNLDRCAPENAINLLESVKNFLIVPGCTWVFAVDSEVIASYINKKYEDTAVNGYDYLDKIIS